MCCACLQDLDGMVLHAQELQDDDYSDDEDDLFQDDKPYTSAYSGLLHGYVVLCRVISFIDWCLLVWYGTRCIIYGAM